MFHPKNFMIVPKIHSLFTVGEIQWRQDYNFYTERLKSYYSPYPDYKDSTHRVPDNHGYLYTVYTRKSSALAKIKFYVGLSLVGCQVNTSRTWVSL
jgi:hypothetical protein